MTRPRRELVDLDATCYYHCICRCVRRAFLWGEDHLTGKNYEHRKQWVVDKLSELSKIFAIEVAAYAVMSNHYHLVLRVNPQNVHDWDEHEVVTRWERLFSVPLIVKDYQDGIASKAEAKVARAYIETWRSRLVDISWFMRSVNEFLARKANKEDKCTGRFWEGRFKSQALLDSGAVLAAMSYVDLNPIRAGMADLPEESDFTSIQQRIRQIKQLKTSEETLPTLMTLTSKETNHPQALHYLLDDYLQLVDWTGRLISEDKRGVIPHDVPTIFDRLRLEPQAFLAHMSGKKHSTLDIARAIGNPKQLLNYAAKYGNKFIRGWKQQQVMYT